MEQQLIYLQRLNELISEQAGATSLLEVAVDAIVKSCALERSAFCMLGSEGKELRAKLVSGLDGRPLRHFFQLRRDDEWATLFFRLMDKRMTLLVPDTDEPGAGVTDCQPSSCNRWIHVVSSWRLWSSMTG